MFPNIENIQFNPSNSDINDYLSKNKFTRSLDNQDMKHSTFNDKLHLPESIILQKKIRQPQDFLFKKKIQELKHLQKVKGVLNVDKIKNYAIIDGKNYQQKETHVFHLSNVSQKNNDSQIDSKMQYNSTVLSKIPNASYINEKNQKTYDSSPKENSKVSSNRCFDHKDSTYLAESARIANNMSKNSQSKKLSNSSKILMNDLDKKLQEKFSQANNYFPNNGPIHSITSRNIGIGNDNPFLIDRIRPIFYKKKYENMLVERNIKEISIYPKNKKATKLKMNPNTSEQNIQTATNNPELLRKQSNVQENEIVIHDTLTNADVIYQRRQTLGEREQFKPQYGTKVKISLDYSRKFVKESFPGLQVDIIKQERANKTKDSF